MNSHFFWLFIVVVYKDEGSHRISAVCSCSFSHLLWYVVDRTSRQEWVNWWLLIIRASHWECCEIWFKADPQYVFFYHILLGFGGKRELWNVSHIPCWFATISTSAAFGSESPKCASYCNCDKRRRFNAGQAAMSVIIAIILLVCCQETSTQILHYSCVNSLCNMKLNNVWTRGVILSLYSWKWYTRRHILYAHGYTWSYPKPSCSSMQPNKK